MAVEFAVAGVRLGLERPAALAALPAAALALGYLALRGQGTAGRGRRAVLLGTRLLVAVLLVGAAAGPYTITVEETAGDPRVTMLVDRSASTAVAPPVADDLAAAIEAEGVPVTRRTVASGNGSRLGDAVVSGLRTNGSVLLVSDGQVTGGRSLGEAAELARSVNATVHAVALAPNRTEGGVRVVGPEKTSVGVENTFLARVEGVNLAGERRLTISVDGEQVNETTIRGSGEFAFSHTFEETGSHRITARLAGGDAFGNNDAFYRTVRVVEKPRVLYVSRGDYPLGELLNETYDLERASRVPADLEEYLAVVVQDVPAEEVGNVSALQRYVIDGNGLVVAGGHNAFGNGGYSRSPLSALLPVRNGTGGRSARVVLAVDVSSSTAGGLRLQKALALDALDQLGDRNVVGVVAFDLQAYRVAGLRPLGRSRAQVEDRIRRLQSGGGTRIAVGLRGAGKMLDGGGTVILLSDGQDTQSNAVAAARRLGARGTRVIAVGVGRRVNEPHLREIAEASGGTYFRADETNRLRVLFGGDSRQFHGRQLTVVDSNHFITAGVEPTAKPGLTHGVVVKDGADYLVAGAEGNPALASWRFGLGRVVAVTAYDSDGTLDGLLTRPDSLLLTKSVNWAIGDPERKQEGVVEVGDARVGRPAEVTVRAEDRPEAPGLRFVRTGERTYRATVVPDERGYASVLDAEYAANYHPEYGAFGVSPALREAVRTTGGQVFEPDRAGAIAAAVKRRAAGVREVRRTWAWALLVAALLVYLTEVLARRIEEVTDYRLLPQ